MGCGNCKVNEKFCLALVSFCFPCLFFLFRSVLRKACGKEAVNENDEDFVDPLPEKLRATVVSSFC